MQTLESNDICLSLIALSLCFFGIIFLFLTSAGFYTLLWRKIGGWSYIIQNCVASGQNMLWNPKIKESN